MGKKISDDDYREILEFDWDISKLKPMPMPVLPKKPVTWLERTEVMLQTLQSFTISCTMCSLGKQRCVEHNTEFDPQVFSTMNPSKWVVVGQNPGYNECLQQKPFVGDAGKFFDTEIMKNGLKRDDFYISNVCKCHTIGNAAPDFEYVKNCEPILRMELMILKPRLVITLGSVAFAVFCPDLEYRSNLGQITRSQKFNIDIYPIYHPSPRNMNLVDRRNKFVEDIENLCKLIKICQLKQPT